MYELWSVPELGELPCEAPETTSLIRGVQRGFFGAAAVCHPKEAPHSQQQHHALRETCPV